MNTYPSHRSSTRLTTRQRSSARRELPRPSVPHAHENVISVRKPTKRDEELRVVRILRPVIRHRHEPAMCEAQQRMYLIFERFCRAALRSLRTVAVQDTNTYHRKTTLRPRPRQYRSCLQFGRQNRGRLCCNGEWIVGTWHGMVPVGDPIVYLWKMTPS